MMGLPSNLKVCIMIWNLTFITNGILDRHTPNEQFNEGHDPIQYGPHLPEAYIKVIPHPKSANQVSLIIPLVGNSPARGSMAVYVPQLENQPWAPFRTLEDFEVTEIAITSLMRRPAINKLLTGVTGKWSNGNSSVTLKKYSDMDAVLSKARKYVVQVRFLLQSFKSLASDATVSSSTKKCLQNSMEKFIILHFNIEIPGSIYLILSTMNLLCRPTCGTPSRNIIARVHLKSRFSTSQTLQRHGGMLTCVHRLLISLRINDTNTIDVVRAT